MSHAMSLPGVSPTESTTQRWLWVGLGALAATTLALGAALLQVYHRSADEVSPAVPLTPISAITATVQALPPLDPAVHSPPTPTAKTLSQNASKPRAHTARAASKSVASKTSNTLPAVAAAAPLMCAQCGRVESVTPIQREAKPSGVGAVAGAVVGGIVGNQFGGGDGKTLATIAGMVGGGWAGNTVEKKMKTETIYRVEVRMENGSLRTLEQTEPVAVGSRVTVEGATLRNVSVPSQTL